MYVCMYVCACRSFVKVVSSGVQAISAGGYHSMVLKLDGSLWATGNAYWETSGEQGSSADRSVFVKVVTSGVQAVSAGFLFTLIVKTDGSVWATGDNRYGQLGDGSTTGRRSFVRVISSGAKAVAARSFHSMVSAWVDGWLHVSG